MNTAAGLERALAELARFDPRMGALWERAGTPDPRRRPPGFATLLRTIVAQQLSFRAAATIWRRIEDLCGVVTPEAILGAEEEVLREAGLSWAKLAYARALAQAVTSGALPLTRIARMTDEEAITALVAVKGLGRWSGECYLLFAHGRPDIWPAADLALANAVTTWLGLDERLRPKALAAHAEAWRPVRSAAARLFWHAYAKEVL